MGSILLWLNIHRMLVVILLGAAAWIGAYVSYLRPTVMAIINRGKPHNWAVDMVTKKAISRGKTEV
jgi:hypothetical protein